MNDVRSNSTGPVGPSDTFRVPAACEEVTRLVRHELQLRRVTVQAVERPTPRLVRVTLGGSELTGFVSMSPDDHVKVLFPDPNERDPRLPEVVAGQVRWPARVADRPIARDYTPLRYDPVSNTLDLEIVLHEGGYAAGWAERAQPGDRLGIGGPRGSHVLVAPIEGLLLVGDETALPAIARWLSELPAGASVHAYIEVAGAAEERPLPTAARASVFWVHRGRDRAGGQSRMEELIAAARLPEPLSYAWVAGEATQVKRIARELVAQRGVPRERLRARGYWKHGVRDHQEPHDD